MGPAAEQAVVQAAIARGYFTPAQVAELRKVHAQRAAAGRPAAFLTVLAERLAPPQREVLRQVYQQGHDSGSGPAPKQGFDADGATIDTTPQPAAFDDFGVTVDTSTGRFDPQGATIDTGRYDAKAVQSDSGVGETLLESAPSGPIFDVHARTQMLDAPEMAGGSNGPGSTAPTLKGNIMGAMQGGNTPPPTGPGHTPPPGPRKTGSLGEVGFRDLQTLVDTSASNEDALDTIQPHAPTTGRMASRVNMDESNPTGAGAIAPTLLEGPMGEVTDEHTHPEMPSDKATSSTGLQQSLATAADQSGRQRRQAEPARERIADYEVLSELGRGGMGVVYEARSLTLERRVALKVLLAGTRAGGQEVERFKIEARAAARLRHPNIVRLLEQGEDDEGHMYLAMDFIQGRSLHQMLREDGPLDINEAARISKLMADALHYAHEQSILHRDVKPHNVLLDQGGIPYITDFGLAKLVGDQSQSLTGAGTMMGTPGFMPPEQAGAQGLKPDARSDVYSLGATLYCILTGKPPFHAPTIGETLMFVLNKPPKPPTKARAEIPRDLETICLKCLEKVPEDRYQTAAELSADLERFLGDQTIVGKRLGAAKQASRWAGRHKFLVAFVVLCFTLATGGGGFAIHKAIQDKTPAEIAEANRLAKEKRDRLAKEQREKLAKERADQEAKAKADRERIAKEQADAEAAAKSREERLAAKERAAEEQRKKDEAAAREREAELERQEAAAAEARRIAAEEAAAKAEENRLEEERLAGIDSKLKNDKVPPRIEILAPLGRKRNTNKPDIHVELKVTDEENEVVKVTLGGVNLKQLGDSLYGGLWKLTKEKKNTTSAVAVDKAGNEARLEIVAYLDTKPPEVKSLILRPKGSEVTAEDLKVWVILDDPGTVTVGDQEIQTKWVDKKGNVAHAVVPLKVGMNTIPLSVTDELGNTEDRPMIEVTRELPVVLRNAWWKPHPKQKKHALEKKKRVAFKNSLGMEFALIPPGSFSMGSPAREPGREKKEEARHEVTLTKSFYMLRNEVTNAQFRRFKADHDSGAFKGRDMNGDKQPAVKVSWEMAREFCNWLSDQEGEPGLYRLPTEAEWEYACRAGSDSAYYWGEVDQNGLVRAKAFANCLDQEAAKVLPFDPEAIEGIPGKNKFFLGGDRYVVTAPVGTFEPNAFGLYDTIGNAAEWCSDFHGDYGSGPATDPIGPERGTSRIFRGGSWDSHPTRSRAAYRGAASPKRGYDFNGFRVVATRAKPAR